MKRKNKISILESMLVLILGLYPLRHIYWGVDLMDTGYNYANFQYMGVEHMDPMWLFSTYLANVVGNFLTKLPAADSLAGMNLYTGIFISVLAIAGYLFCTRKLNIPPAFTFVGEFVAISLCWCPTALLYNYLTYVLFLGCVILLYFGLTEERKWCLFAAGICLGTNVFVRFSNLPEAAMIVAVWAYGVLEALEYRKAQKEKNSRQVQNGKETGSGQAENGKGNGRVENRSEQAESWKENRSGKSAQGKAGKSGAWGRTVNRTLWCLAGYLAAVLVFLGYIGIRYGLDAYIAGIQRLFAMTDNAADYKATSMLTALIHTYIDNLYWVIRILVIVLAGMLICGILRWLGSKCALLAKDAGAKKVWERCCNAACIAVCAALALAMLVWLYVYANGGDGFCSWAFYSYDSMLRPGILFLMLTLLITVIKIFQRNGRKEEKLIAGMILLVVLLTSIGSNNGVFPSLNNLFVAAPYTLWQCWLFLKNVTDKRINIGKRKHITLQTLAAKCILTAFLAMFLFQSVMFGAEFVFAEGTGVQDISAKVTNNEVLKGIKMSPERAEWMNSISAYVEEKDLQGREVILYGQIPSLSYYLQMPSAFNPWSDLLSYSVSQMEIDMAELMDEIDKGAERPVVIADATKIDKLKQDVKWQMIVDFMEKYGYEQTFSNEKFVMWE